jgi:hypothetical protein
MAISMKSKSEKQGVSARGKIKLAGFDALRAEPCQSIVHPN